MRYLVLCFVVLSIPFFSNCNRKMKKQQSKSLSTLSQNGISLIEIETPNSNSSAELKMAIQETSMEELDQNKIHLGISSNHLTTNQNNVVCLVDNEFSTLPTSQNFILDTKNDGMHTILCVLLDQNQISIKSKSAYSVENYITGKSRYYAKYANKDLSLPLVFLLQPINESNSNTAILDFYILNCDLSEAGYKVKANINGTNFILTQWSAYTIKGLKSGENTITLELVDAQNNLVESPFNQVSRTIHIK